MEMRKPVKLEGDEGRGEPVYMKLADTEPFYTVQ